MIKKLGNKPRSPSPKPNAILAIIPPLPSSRIQFPYFSVVNLPYSYHRYPRNHSHKKQIYTVLSNFSVLPLNKMIMKGLFSKPHQWRWWIYYLGWADRVLWYCHTKWLPSEKSSMAIWPSHCGVIFSSLRIAATRINWGSGLEYTILTGKKPIVFNE